MAPQAAPCQPGLAGEAFVFVSVCGDCVSVSDEPCANVFTLTYCSAQKTTVLVLSFDRDLNVLATDCLGQCNFDALAVIEPITMLVFGELIPFRRIEASKAYVVPRDPYPIAIGHIRLAHDRRTRRKRRVARARAGGVEDE